MPSKDKVTHTCECGHTHTVSKRTITINKEMVHSLAAVRAYLLQRGNGYMFTRKEVKKLFRSETATARFGDLVYFGGILFKEKKGTWGMNMERAELFLTNKATVADHIIKDPITGSTETSGKRVLMRQVKGVEAFLDADGEFIVQYQ